jgi:alkylation response protein AidB-like acyl-CoA dehydrogenase
MDWNDTPEQAAFRAEVRTFITEHLPERYRAQAAQGGALGPEQDWQSEFVLGDPETQAAAKEWLEALASRSWVAPHWPREYGGGGLSPIEQFILRQEFALAAAPAVGGQGVTMFGPTLLVHGTEEQKQKYLPPTLRGEMLWAQGFSEPGAGSDLASLQCRAVRDGDEYVINGQKLWTSTAHKSNWLFGMFRTDPDAPKHRGISFLLLSLATPGVSVRPIVSMGFQHATNETFYEDVRVPADQLVGEENRGWYVGMTLLDYERSNIAGAVENRRYLDSLIQHIGTDDGRQQTEPRRDLARRNVADRYIESEVLYNFSFRIISMQSSGQVPNYEASVTKIANSELAQKVARTGMALFGPYANLWDPDDPYTPLGARFTQNYCHTVLGTIGGGANEIQRNIIATRGLGLPRG